MNEEDSEERLKQLESLLLSRFDFNSSNSNSTYLISKEQLEKIQDDSNDVVQETSPLQVSFKLLSTDKSPQLINIQSEPIKPSEVKPELVIIYPEKSIESKRILDVDDESKEVKKLRRKQIKSMAIDHITLRTLAQQIPNKPGPQLVSYRTKMSPKIPVDTTKTSISQATPMNQEKNASPSAPVPQITYLAKLDAIIPDVNPKKNETQMVNQSLKPPKNTTQGELKPHRSILTPTQRRKNRRSRQIYRRNQLDFIDKRTKVDIPKLVKMSYL
ncbi:hypothetical protein DFH28DRAFT_1140924 [Melampsora americana]|nr:hypothetical protein DFH28DRAFT_1140924 [Melampsora americana]